MSAPPLIVLGVGRSGTTLLRVMLDRHSELAVPDESYFLPQLYARHGKQVDVEEFLEDLNRLPTIREWEIDLSSIGSRIAGSLERSSTSCAGSGRSPWRATS